MNTPVKTINAHRFRTPDAPMCNRETIRIDITSQLDALTRNLFGAGPMTPLRRPSRVIPNAPFKGKKPRFLEEDSDNFFNSLRYSTPQKLRPIESTIPDAPVKQKKRNYE